MNPSSRQEVNQSASSMEVLETSPSGDATLEGTREDRRGRQGRPVNSSRASSTPSDRKVEGAGARSSVPTGNKGSDVSKKKNTKPTNKITGPDKPEWQS